VNEDPALPARRDRHVAADEKGEAAEHLLLGEIGLAGNEFPYPIRELLVVGHHGDRTRDSELGRVRFPQG
jgi:hypothetical protein